MRTLLPVSARPPRIHRASVNKGGKNEVTKCNLGGDWPQLHLPGLLVLELGQIGAERAGADAAREVLGQVRIIAPDALDAGADVFGYQRTGPLDVRGASTHAAIPPDTRGKLVAERLELALRALFGAGIGPGSTNRSARNHSSRRTNPTLKPTVRPSSIATQASFGSVRNRWRISELGSSVIGMADGSLPPRGTIRSFSAVLCIRRIAERSFSFASL